jgi:chaperonin GroES|tara:strand:- start:279 stop:569 length:291 start_codon:yes stop_codon:yes gene_type:complete
MTIKFQPLNNLVLIDVEQKTEDKTKGGIIMTNVAKPDEGIAVAVGLGLKTRTGTRIPMTVKKGDKVKFTYLHVREIKVDNKTYYLTPETEIQGIIE